MTVRWLLFLFAFTSMLQASWAQEFRLGEFSLVLNRYEGIEYSCHIKKNLCWYEFRGKKIAKKTLTPAEQQRLIDSLNNEKFWTLPASMGNTRTDSSSTVKIWRSGKLQQVRSTDSPGEEPGEAFRRFERILHVIESIAPLPRDEIQSSWVRPVA